MYYVLQNTDFNNLPVELQGITRKFGKYQGNKTYCLVNFPINENSLSKFRLTGHHITIFENDSFYHYTAYLENEIGEKFRVHVYFNTDDQVDGKPIFDLQISETKYENQKNSNHDQAFIKQAEEACEPIIAFLRARQAALLEKHKKQLKKLDKQAEDLSQNLTQNKELYLKVSERQLNEMHHIKRYLDNPLPILGRIELLHSLRKSIQKLEIEPIAEKDEVEPQDSESSDKSVQLAFFDRPRSNKTSKKVSCDSFYLKRIQEIKQLFLKWERPVQLATLYKEIQVLENSCELEVQDRTSEVRGEIKKLKMELMTREQKKYIAV